MPTLNLAVPSRAAVGNTPRACMKLLCRMSTWLVAAPGTFASSASNVTTRPLEKRKLTSRYGHGGSVFQLGPDESLHVRPPSMQAPRRKPVV
ncbi:hypothetical protein BV22DRAFT_1135795 [Leucogyrophana mollusca]|uniref:Uncharacterized protein n=1 Tax=Leucogyrophana mollusca TaxID=85980 RepID=A0ACB8ATW8_9AGAM|nr:hypothetical protein BV22DRAFT_1135795 [Leucogyrophana mollusca]